ncbi:complement factor B-like, partial [Cetorhinus maximus]
MERRLCNGTERIWGGRVLYPEDRRAGGVLRYVCPGTQRAYPVSWRVCLPSGSWSPLRNAFREHSHAAKCLAYKCVGPTYIENGFFYPRKISYAVNETIEFECDQGFQLIGSRNRTCLPNGRWSGRTTVCDAGDSFCPDPGIPLGGSRRGNRFDEGDFVTYFCFTGLVLKGAERRRCDSSGRWQGTEATCEFPYSYDEPRIVAQKLTLSEEIINHAKQGSDLHIVVDASGSVGKENFEKSLRFIEIFSEMTTEISSGVGYFVVVFASKVLFARHYPPSFSIYVDRQELNYSNYIDHMGTNIGEALTKVLEHVNETMQKPGGHGVRGQIILLITDGRQNVGPDPTDVVEKIKDTVPDPDQNLDIFAIGIGDASKPELEKLTTKKGQTHSYYFNSYDQLVELTDLIDQPESGVTGCGIRGRSRRARSFGRIYGGERVEEKQWPWQIYLKMGAYAGGGSIVSPSWVLTAAHNMFVETRVINASEVKVRFGSLRSSTTRVRNVIEIHIHSRFNMTEALLHANYAYDIALLRIDQEISFSEKIRPVCLPCTKEVNDFLPSPAGTWHNQCKYQDRILTGFSGTEPREISGYVSGWGLTERNMRSPALKFGLISIQPRDECRKDDLDESQLCAKGDGVDACQ